MTRFARSKGSKSSNERLPEEATSWSEMKKQLSEKNKEIEEERHRQSAIDKRNANYKAFLDEKLEEETNHTKWSEFPGLATINGKSKGKNKAVNKNKKTSIKDESIDIATELESSINELKEKFDKILDYPGKRHDDESDSDGPPEEESAKKEIQNPVVKIKKRKKKKLKIPMEKDKRNSPMFDKNAAVSKKPSKKAEKLIQSDHINNSKLNGKRISSDNLDNIENKKRKIDKLSTQESVDNSGKKSARKKKSKNSNKGEPQKKVIKENLSEADLKRIQKKKDKRIKQVEKRNKVKAELKKQKEEMEQQQINNTLGVNTDVSTHHLTNENSIADITLNDRFNDNSHSVKKYPKKPLLPSDQSERQKNKVRDKEKHPRKKPLLPHKMFINGKELEVAYVEGFPVKKEDSERLTKLRKEMISKGLPRSQINVALKLERRRAEKAFSREKKKVCFNCRKSGHNLSECPELNKDQFAHNGTGICFKCGSTEHTHFECKVVRGQEFKFASCFICNEQGHIARQCPDNARGLYPKGGGCNVCGDVTHLKKDCPKYQGQQYYKESGMKIKTLSGSNPDALEDVDESKSISRNVKPNKIVKF